jgi:hypothetical protein
MHILTPLLLNLRPFDRFGALHVLPLILRRTRLLPDRRILHGARHLARLHRCVRLTAWLLRPPRPWRLRLFTASLAALLRLLRRMRLRP